MQQNITINTAKVQENVRVNEILTPLIIPKQMSKNYQLDSIEEELN